MNFSTHCCVGLLLRLFFITFGIVQDYVSEVPYTDIDYKVFTDGARHILEGKSPYDRTTYRYSPLIAFFLLPNVIVHPVFGKLLFSIIDVAVSVVAYRILLLDGLNKEKSKWYSLFWLYNPLSVVISTRGNADAIAAFLVLWSLLKYKEKKWVTVGAILALLIHLRIYPVLFGLPMYICIKDKHSNGIVQLIYPNKSRSYLVSSCVFTLLIISFSCYYVYGDDFLNESIIYHIKRRDTRHNYSVYFYLQYLFMVNQDNWTLKFFMIVPQLVLFLVFPLSYRNEKHLPFCEFCLTFILVTYNSVLTCQYFIWYLCLLPLLLPHLSFGKSEAILSGTVWFASLIMWLLPAYMLEFKSYNTFLWIWIQGLTFFGANIFVLTRLLNNYNITKLKNK